MDLKIAFRQPPTASKSVSFEDEKFKKSRNGDCIKAMVVFRFLINIFYCLQNFLKSSSFHQFVKIFDVEWKEKGITKPIKRRKMKIFEEYNCDLLRLDTSNERDSPSICYKTIRFYRIFC